MVARPLLSGCFTDPSQDSSTPCLLSGLWANFNVSCEILFIQFYPTGKYSEFQEKCHLSSTRSAMIYVCVIHIKTALCNRFNKTF